MSAPEPGEDDWYANLLVLDRRKCLLLTHRLRRCSASSNQMFESVSSDRHRELVSALVERELREEQLPPDTFGDMRSEELVIAKTADRSVLGCMNDMAFLAEVAVGPERRPGLAGRSSAQPPASAQHQQRPGLPAPHRPRPREAGAVASRCLGRPTPATSVATGFDGETGSGGSAAPIWADDRSPCRLADRFRASGSLGGGRKRTSKAGSPTPSGTPDPAPSLCPRSGRSASGRLGHCRDRGGGPARGGRETHAPAPRSRRSSDRLRAGRRAPGPNTWRLRGVLELLGGPLVVDGPGLCCSSPLLQRSSSGRCPC